MYSKHNLACEQPNASNNQLGLSLARASSIQPSSSLVNYSKRLPFNTVKGMLVLSESWFISCTEEEGGGTTGTSPTLLAWDGSSMGTGNHYLAALEKQSWTGEH